MKHLSYFIIPVALAFLSSCYHEVDLDNYRDEESANLLTLNSIVNPDSTVSASATRTYFFSDKHNSRQTVEGLDMELWLNDEQKAEMRFNPATSLYESSVRPKEGDKVEIRTAFKGKAVTSSGIVPRKVGIESIDVERQGPMTIYYSNDYLFTYRIKFTDAPGEEKYYFLQYDAADRRTDLTMGERDFTYEFVFRQLAKQVNANIPGWTPYSPNGLPFSDRGIDGTTHTLVVKEIVQDPAISIQSKQMHRKFLLYSISKDYYDYLVSIICNDSGEGGIHSGMIDLGIADPIRIHSNIAGGTGILGCYSLDTKEVDIFATTGPFPQ